MMNYFKKIMRDTQHTQTTNTHAHRKFTHTTIILRIVVLYFYLDVTLSIL